ncbi:MAG: ABC transporter permease [Anaerolineales bacterium]|nr:ABC transporter permease [Anaerolineales bacterium]
MNAAILATLLRKDLILFFSNRFFAFITFLALFAYAAIYYLLPADIDETLEMAVYAPNLPAQFLEELGEEGLIMIPIDSERALQEAVRQGEHAVGVILPADFFSNLAIGMKGEVYLYFSADFSEEFRQMYAILFTEIGYMVSGKPLNIEVTEEILGEDRVGDQIAYRDRLLPLMVVIILTFETMGLASLIASEVTTGTLQALLITPLRVEGLFLAKGTFGTGLAFIQAVLLMAIIGGLNHKPEMILVILFLGSVLVTGLAFLIASVSKEMMSAMGWGMLAVVVLSLPSFSVLLPGSVTDWVKAIPSYHIVDPIYRIVNQYTVTWSDLGVNLAILTVSAGFIFALGVVVLRRKFQ